MEREYRFGVSEFTTWPWSFEQDLEVYAAAGCSDIEICEFKLDRQGFAAQLDAIAQTGMGVSSFQTTVHSIYPDSLAGLPTGWRERVAIIEEAIVKYSPRLPKDVAFNVITGAAPNGDCRKVCDDCVEAFKRLGERAAQCDMRVAFEPLNPVLFNTDTALWGLHAALELVDRVDHPAVGVCCDFWNVFETPDLPTVIRDAAERIFLVQVSDWGVPRCGADRRSIGGGTIDMLPLVRALRDIRYSNAYVLEIFSDQSLPDSLWRGDMRTMVAQNAAAFAAVWRASGE